MYAYPSARCKQGGTRGNGLALCGWLTQRRGRPMAAVGGMSDGAAEATWRPLTRLSPRPPSRLSAHSSACPPVILPIGFLGPALRRAGRIASLASLRVIGSLFIPAPSCSSRGGSLVLLPPCPASPPRLFPCFFFPVQAPPTPKLQLVLTLHPKLPPLLTP